MKFYGKEIVITSEVQYIGEGENPKDNPGFILWKEALKRCHDQKFYEFKKDLLESIYKKEGDDTK